MKTKLENIVAKTILLKMLSLAIQNLETESKMKTIQINDAAIKIRFVVMTDLYRKCKYKARYRSIAIPVIVSTDAPAVMYPTDSDSILVVQYMLKLLWYISPILWITKHGCPINPTVKSLNAKQQRKTFDGVCRAGFCQTASITRAFPIIAVRDEMALRMEVNT